MAHVGPEILLGIVALALAVGLGMSRRHRRIREQQGQIEQDRREQSRREWEQRDREREEQARAARLATLIAQLEALPIVSPEAGRQLVPPTRHEALQQAQQQYWREGTIDAIAELAIPAPALKLSDGEPVHLHARESIESTKSIDHDKEIVMVRIGQDVYGYGEWHTVEFYD
jgi:hypothetical protein